MSQGSQYTADRVAIVLVNWNGWQECVECLDSLLVQTHRNFHIYIIDNESADLSVEQIEKWCAVPKAASNWRTFEGIDRLTYQSPTPAIGCRVASAADGELAAPRESCLLTLIRSGANLGFAGGCNVGSQSAGLENFAFFWFLNPDTVAARTALAELIQRATRNPTVGMVGSTLRDYYAPNVIQALGGARLNALNGRSSHIGQGMRIDAIPVDGADVEREMTYVVGASMLVSARFIKVIGLMAEDYFLYYEEIDWAMRGRHQFTLAYAPRSHVFHKSGANSSKVMPELCARYYYRNRLRFVRRFLPGRIGAARRALFIDMLRHVAKGRWAMARIVGSVLLSEFAS